METLTRKGRAAFAERSAKKRHTWPLALAGLTLALTACATETLPPSITSFTSTTITGGATYRWQITGGAGDTLTCALDATGNGTADAIIPDCATTTSHSYSFTTPGRYDSELTVTDDRGRSDTASVTAIAAGTSATPATWAVQFGTSGADYGSAITSDADGNTTIAGETDGALPGYTNAGSSDIVIAKYDPHGNQLWASQFGTDRWDGGSGITSDADGNTTLVGYTTGALPGESNAGWYDIVLAKYDPAGNQLWTRQLGTDANDFGFGITRDADGNTTLVGTTYGALPGFTNIWEGDILLAKYDPDGNQLWATQFGTDRWDGAAGITSDANGNTILVGSTEGVLPGHTNTGASDIVVAKYDPAGNQVWATQFGTSGRADGLGITSDANGNTTIVGNTDGALPGHTNAGGWDIVLARYDSDGNQLWATQFGTSADDGGEGITSDANGNTTIVGYTNGALPGASNAGRHDIVLAKYDPDGNQLWARQYGTSDFDRGHGITSDASGNAALVGSTWGALPGYTNAGSGDIVIAKWPP